MGVSLEYLADLRVLLEALAELWVLLEYLADLWAFKESLARLWVKLQLEADLRPRCWTIFSHVFMMSRMTTMKHKMCLLNLQKPRKVLEGRRGRPWHEDDRDRGASDSPCERDRHLLLLADHAGVAGLDILLEIRNNCYCQCVDML